MAQQGEVEKLFQRLAELSAEIRGLFDSGLPRSDEAQRAEQLHREVVALNRVLLHGEIG
jgi:hypothetical protein